MEIKSLNEFVIFHASAKRSIDRTNALALFPRFASAMHGDDPSLIARMRDAVEGHAEAIVDRIRDR
jgi:hypothetical protein